MAVAGIFKEPITIKRPHAVKNQYGEEVIEYDTIWNTRARIVHDGGGRSTENESIFYTSLKTLEIRRYVPIDYFDIVEWDGRKYRVIDIEPFIAQQKQQIKIELIND